MLTANQNQMTFKTSDLITKLKDNREKHIAEYNDAYAGYVSIVGDKLAKALKDYKAGKLNLESGFDIRVAAPATYEEEYNTVISMLEMCTDETIVLDRSSFCNYVLDQWSWQKSFKATTALYASAKV